MTGICIDVLTSAELVEAAEVEETRLDSVVEVDASSDDVIVADGREEAVAVGVCERFEGLSS